MSDDPFRYQCGGSAQCADRCKLCSVMCQNTVLLETQGLCGSVRECSADTVTDDTGAQVEDVTAGAACTAAVAMPCVVALDRHCETSKLLLRCCDECRNLLSPSEVGEKICRRFILQNTDDRVTSTVAARRARQQRGTIITRDLIDIMASQRKADKRTPSRPIILERSDCSGQSIDVVSKVRAFNVMCGTYC